MVSTRRIALLSIASLLLSAFPVYAGGGGGGGTKRPSQIIFVNSASTGVAVTTDITAGNMPTVLAEDPVQVKDFLAAGGKFISTGSGTATFRVAAGTYANVGATDQGFANPMTTTSVTVAQGQTVYVYVSGSLGALVVSTTAP